MNPQIELPHNWLPRDYQEPLWASMENGIKRAMLFWHRRAGKDLCMINWIGCSAMKRTGAYWHIFPTYKQGKKSMWEGKTKDGRRFMDHFPEEIVARRREQELTLDFINGSQYVIVGADNPDSQVGTNPVGMVFSEWALMDPSIWTLLQPILAENDGWAIFVTTPRGRNHAYRMYQRNKANPKWFCEVLSYKQTKAISEEAVKEAIEEGMMSEDKAAQEFECSFDAALEHAYFGKEMRIAAEEGRIGHFPHDPRFPVETWWDIGVSDYTAIWFVQRQFGSQRFVHYYKNVKQGLPHYHAYLDRMRSEKNFVYREHLLPHDAEVTEWGTGQTRVERFADAGYKNVRVVPKIPLYDGIEATRAILATSYWHEDGCEGGLEALRQYSRKPLEGQTDDEGNQMYGKDPNHDWASHGADALRTGAVGARRMMPNSTEGDGPLSAPVAMI